MKEIRARSAGRVTLIAMCKITDDDREKELEAGELARVASGESSEIAGPLQNLICREILPTRSLHSTVSAYWRIHSSK